MIREQQPIRKKIKLIVLFSPLIEWVDTSHLMRLYVHDKSIEQGRENALKSSRKRIKGFVENYGIDMSQFTPSDLDAYENFEDFFVRHHRPGSRPIHAKDDPSQAVVVADSRVVVYDTVSKSKEIWIKGHDFSIATLTMDMKLGDHFAEGGIASFRLSPQDYHRYHSPVSGVIKLFRSLPGDYYEVDPLAIRSSVDILTRNRREYVVIETEEFGDVLFVAIGATSVGTVR
jgi:phosphatidylserine decarboxylase